MQIACDADDLPAVATVQRWPAAVLEHLGHRLERDHEITVRIVGAGESRALNSRYRGRDKETNVLSFPAGESRGLPDGELLSLGDLVLCAPVVAQEAEAQGKNAGSHWAHLLVHGTLHLLGYDHETDAGALQMEALEVAILAAAGVADPYIVRDSGR